MISLFLRQAGGVAAISKCFEFLEMIATTFFCKRYKFYLESA